MKTVKNRELYYCDQINRCVIRYPGITNKGIEFKGCSHIDPASCVKCELYVQSLKVFTMPRKKEAI